MGTPRFTEEKQVWDTARVGFVGGSYFAYLTHWKYLGNFTMATINWCYICVT